MFENLQTEIDNLIDSIKTQQLDYVIENGKYKQFPITETSTVKYEVHEKVSSKGVGFTCLFYATQDGKEYVKIYGFGVEANTSDWNEIIEDLI